MIKTINCGRLDNIAGFSRDTGTENNIRRIYSAAPCDMAKPNYYPISTDGRQIMHAGGLSDLNYFIENIFAYRGRRLIVLTAKEYSLIYEKVKECGIDLRIFEEDYPIFVKIKLTDSLLVNFNSLNKLLKRVDFLEIRGGSFVRDQATKHLHAVARKIRFKSSLDHQFFFAFNEGYQEVFKLKEERADRVVVALDFNSMYASCLNGKFCDPRSIGYKCFEPVCKDPYALDEGAYLVTLRDAKSSFFLEKHPFLYKRLGDSHRFNLNVDDSVQVVLFRSEIIYYSKFFKSVDIHEGYCTTKTVSHPLLKKSIKYYAKRRQHKMISDSVMESFYKMSLQLMHSATNQKVYRRRIFESLDDLKNFLSLNFNLSFLGVTDYHLSKFFQRSKYFKITSFADKIELKYLDIKSDDQLFVLSARVVAEARLKLVQTIEGFLSDGTTELCYANVDSLHISVLKTELDNFFARNRDLISSDMGCLKVQSIADKGYWFDVGRYWLKTDEEVIQFKNVGFNSRYAKSEFVEFRKIPIFSNYAAFNHLGQVSLSIENSFGYGKRVELSPQADSINFNRYNFSEVSDLTESNITISNEVLNSKKIKMNLFKYISSRVR